MSKGLREPNLYRDLHSIENRLSKLERQKINFLSAPSGDLDMNDFKIINLGDPIDPTDAVNYQTLTSSIGSITAGAGLTKTGTTIDAVGTANRITVNPDSIDISSSYVGQTSITTLGTIGTGTWQGSVIAEAYIDAAIARLASPAFTGVPTAPTAASGTNTTQLATTAYVVDAIGTAGGTFQPLDSDLTALAGITTTGLLARTGSGTATTRSIVNGSARVSVTNGDGVADNPSIDVVQASLDHGSIGGLTDDDHSQYALLAGRSGGNTFTGFLRANSLGLGVDPGTRLFYAQTSASKYLEVDSNGLFTYRYDDTSAINPRLILRNGQASATANEGFNIQVNLQTEDGVAIAASRQRTIKEQAWTTAGGAATRNAAMLWELLRSGVLVELMRITSLGQLKLPGQGVDGGLLIGTDIPFWRTANKVAQLDALLISRGITAHSIDARTVAPEQPISVADGGTGSSNVDGARQNLGIPKITVNETAPSNPSYGDMWVQV